MKHYMKKFSKIVLFGLIAAIIATPIEAGLGLRYVYPKMAQTVSRHPWATAGTVGLAVAYGGYSYVNRSGQKETLECAICLDNTPDDSPWIKISCCKKDYHWNCLNHWIQTGIKGTQQNQQTCPLCRQKFVLPKTICTTLSSEYEEYLTKQGFLKPSYWDDIKRYIKNKFENSKNWIPNKDNLKDIAFYTTMYAAILVCCNAIPILDTERRIHKFGRNSFNAGEHVYNTIALPFMCAFGMQLFRKDSYQSWNDFKQNCFVFFLGTSALFWPTILYHGIRLDGFRNTAKLFKTMFTPKEKTWLQKISSLMIKR